jgi:PPOX class probable F420-dependent enzyme
MADTTPDLGNPRPSTSEALEREPVIWLSSIRDDGGPHIVLSWFVWDGEAILVFSKPNAQKVRNVRADDRVMLAVGSAERDFDVELVEATAEVFPETTGTFLPGAFAGKYAELADRAGLTMDLFAATYSQPIRIRPMRWFGWGGPGWTGPERSHAE